jgi:signal peptidase I
MSLDLLRGILPLRSGAGRPSVLRIEGGSMRPLLRHGSRIVLRQGGAPARFGAVVVAVPGSGMVVHRVVARRRRGAGLQYRLKGDANPEPDAVWLDSAAIVGVVEGAVREPAVAGVRRLGLVGLPAGAAALLSIACGAVLRLRRRLRGWRIRERVVLDDRPGPADRSAAPRASSRRRALP